VRVLAVVEAAVRLADGVQHQTAPDEIAGVAARGVELIGQTYGVRGGAACAEHPAGTLEPSGALGRH
jgi:hypothetical protein